MKKIFLLIILLISNANAVKNYDKIPTKFKNDLSIFSPKNKIITIKDTILIKGQIKSDYKVKINNEEVTVNEAGRFGHILDLDQLGQNEIILGFENDFNEFNIVRSIIKLKNPKSSILNQKELAFINTSFTSNKIKSSDLKNTFRNNEFGYFLSKISTNKQKESIFIENIMDVSYQEEIQNVVNSKILSVDKNNNFNYKSIINLPIFLTGLSRALNWEFNKNNEYEALSQYKDKWYYDYLSIGFEKGIIDESDLKNIKKAFKIKTFVKYATRIPELNQAILAELEFKNITPTKVDDINRIYVDKKLPKETKIVTDIKLNIDNVTQISKSRKEVTGTSTPNKFFVVNWKKITVEPDGTFDFVVPLNQNTIQINIDDELFTKDLNIDNYKQSEIPLIAEKKTIKAKKIKPKPVAKKQTEPKLAVAKNEFKDLENHWVKDIANELKQQKKIDDTFNFNPNKTMSRAEMAEHIVRITGVTPKTSKLTFKDITNKNKKYGYIQNVVSNKLLKGRSRSTFDPNGKVTKLQAILVAARMLPDLSDETHRAIELPYNDIKRYGWAEKEIQKAYYYRIISKNKSLYPKKKVTNAELISILYKTSNSI